MDKPDNITFAEWYKQLSERRLSLAKEFDEIQKVFFHKRGEEYLKHLGIL